MDVCRQSDGKKHITCGTLCRGKGLRDSGQGRSANALPTNTSSVLRSIKSSKPDAIIVGHIPAAMVVLLKDAMRVGLDVPFHVTGMTMLDGVVCYGGS